MLTEQMKVKSNNEIAPRIFEIMLAGKIVNNITAPGQFMHLKAPRADLSLRRPISIASYDKDTLECTLLYRIIGPGTEAISKLTPGTYLDVMGPLGNGYSLETLLPTSIAFLVGGGIGIPPLYQLSQELSIRGVIPIHILGFKTQSEIFYLDKFKALGDTFVSTDDGTYGIHGTVIDILSTLNMIPSVVYSCGPIALLKSIQEIFKSCSNVQLSLEERMACGIGACYACVCKSAYNSTKNFKVCSDGPVFKSQDIVL